MHKSQTNGGGEGMEEKNARKRRKEVKEWDVRG